MARIRSVKPEFWLDRKLARKLSRDERMLYMGLWNQADEHGRALGDPVVVKGAVFPYDDDLTVSVIDGMLNRLDSVGGVVQRYEVDGDPYLFLPKLGNHQRLEPGKSKSKHPEPPERVDPPASEVVSDRPEKIVAGSEVVSEQVSAAVPEFGNRTASFEPDQAVQPNPSTATIFSDESAQVPGKKSLLYGTGSMEQGGVSQTRPRETKTPPKPHCDKHPGGTPENCGPCAGARKRWIAFNLEREEYAADEAAARAKADRDRAHQAADLRARATAACNQCDEDGYLRVETDEGPQLALCTHDSGESTRHGRAEFRAVRERLREKRTPAPSPEDIARIRAELAEPPPDPNADQSPPDPDSPGTVPTGRSESTFDDESLTTQERTHA